jgi:aminoglycoside phosphotransferase (APT) family kinase protein
MRQMLATSALWRLSGRAGLAIDIDGLSLVDEVVAAVGAATAAKATLRGVTISGPDNAVLRVGLAGRDAAVRLSMTDLGATRLARQRRVLAGIDAALRTPELREHMPRELATGVTRGVAWRAETWHQGHISPRGPRWRLHGSGWVAAHEVARTLAATAPTGHVRPGWAQTWVQGMNQFGAETQRAFERWLQPVEAHRLATAWCHGDLWPGNIIVGHGPVVVIDWEQARPDAPAGVDAVFLELSRLALRSRRLIGVAAARAVSAADALIAPPQLGGVSWVEADPALRAALVAATMVVHALGPEGDRRGDAWARENLDPLLSALARLPS